MIKQLGGSITRRHKELYKRSDRWNGKAFENYELTTMDISLKTLPGLIQENFKGRQNRAPEEELPVIPFDSQSFNPDGQTRFIWYGHSAVFLQMSNLNILIDPMLGSDASPLGPVRTKRFSSKTLDLIDLFPPINLVLLTHDHYDHLDMASVEKLKDKVDKWFVTLGVGRHLEKWGISSSKIVEFDWWDQHEADNISITCTPSRHFSGRGLSDRATSLWGGWAFKTKNEKIYWSGDGGYGSHFKEIGNRLGPFDFGFMECGQYNELWHQIHMYPEESVLAAMDAQVGKALPVHWGGFTLALHNWKDPIRRFVREAESVGIAIATPEIGRVCGLYEDIQTHWWDKFN